MQPDPPSNARKSSSVRARSARFLAMVALMSGNIITAPFDWAHADENGLSFWLPGFFGSLLAAPLQPGWSLTSMYYHTNVAANGSAAVSRQITIGQFNPTVNVSINEHVHGEADIEFLIPSYAFATPVLGGQAAVALVAGYGRNQTSLNATFFATPIPITRTFASSDTVFGLTDLIPQASLRWNSGVNNYMLYATGDKPIGAYDPIDLANLGIGHGALDGGFGYTYFDPKKGHEFSLVSGFTGNFTNMHTGYTNGIDWHTDWAASQFVTKQLQLGVVGYFYQQVTPDQGAAPILGNFESRVIGVGPQIGYIFPLGRWQGYLNLKGYGEFAAQNRPPGWNTWLTFSLSPAPSASAAPIITK